MATLSGADKNLNPSDQKKILAAKEAYAKAQAAGDTNGMKKAHADAEAVRISNGYYGGASGSGYTEISDDSSGSKPFASHPTGYTNIVDRTDTSSLSAEDRAFLSKEDQKKIAALKNAYANAADKDYINSLAEAIRGGSHYSMGRDGNTYSALAYGQGGRSAEEMGQWVSDYMKSYYKTTNPATGGTVVMGQAPGWTNGYSTAMNTRSIANMIRQQMYANEKAMNDSNRETLHEQNLALAELLPKGTTSYNEALGRWETSSGNLGYGYDLSYTQPNVRNDVKNFYGYTDEEMEAWANDTSRYYNFVDTDIARRNAVDESSGYTGVYAQFVNGPYGALQFGTHNHPDNSLHTDVYGDGFYDQEYLGMNLKYDENGNIIKQAPRLKNNNDPARNSPMAASGILAGRGGATTLATEADPYNSAGQRAYYENYGANSQLRVPVASSGTLGGYAGYLQQIYSDALQAQLKALESGYVQNLSELDASQKEVDALYKEQKRQVSGQSAQNSAAWREVANAYGLGSGSVGQASLAQRNQLQSDLNKLNAAQASARTEIQRQRLLLGQQYQLAIEEAIAENNGALAKSLYEEAVRAEEALQQQEQFYANLALQYGKSMMSFAKSTGSGLSRVDEYNIIESAMENGFINDSQARTLLEMMGLL